MAAADLTPLTELVPQMSLVIPGIEQPVALECLSRAAHEFFKRTRLWRAKRDLTIVDEPVRVAPDYQELVEIEKAYWGTSRLCPTPFSDLPSDALDLDTSTSAPSHYTQNVPTLISPYPLVAGTLTVHAWLTVEAVRKYGLDGSDMKQALQYRIPEWAMQLYAHNIIDGALGHAFTLPNTPWANPELSAYHDGMYQKAMDSLASAAVRGQHRAPLRTKGSFL